MRLWGLDAPHRAAESARYVCDGVRIWVGGGCGGAGDADGEGDVGVGGGGFGVVGAVRGGVGRSVWRKSRTASRSEGLISGRDVGFAWEFGLVGMGEGARKGDGDGGGRHGAGGLGKRGWNDGFREAGGSVRDLWDACRCSVWVYDRKLSGWACGDFGGGVGFWVKEGLGDEPRTC